MQINALTDKTLIFIIVLMHSFCMKTSASAKQ